MRITERVVWSLSFNQLFKCLLTDKGVCHRYKYHDILFTDSGTNKNCKRVNIENGVV